jgi:hypothetical protein
LSSLSLGNAGVPFNKKLTDWYSIGMNGNDGKNENKNSKVYAKTLPRPYQATVYLPRSLGSTICNGAITYRF